VECRVTWSWRELLTEDAAEFGAIQEKITAQVAAEWPA